MQKKIIAITGATRGLGQALVPHFANEGHVVTGCGRSARDVRELSLLYPHPHLFEIVDVSNSSQVNEWAMKVLSVLGPPDLLINNAAVMNPLANLWEIPEESFTRLIDVNIKGIANVIRAFVPAMVARKSGVIVNMSSGWGRSTSPQVAPYCATKFAVEGLTLALAQELPKGMAAIPLNPGIINTDMLRECWGDSAREYPDAIAWAQVAAPMLLNLSSRDNGKSMTVS